MEPRPPEQADLAIGALFVPLRSIIGVTSASSPRSGAPGKVRLDDSFVLVT